MAGAEFRFDRLVGGKLRRLLLVYNPRSSHHKQIEEEVLGDVRRLRGWMVGKYVVKKASLKENATSLAKIIRDDDLVIVAGGDGTAAMAVNGVLQSGKVATLGVLGYGNFNDVARMVNGQSRPSVADVVAAFESGKIREIFALEVLVNSEHWRFVPAYVTVGLLAEATELMNEKTVRKDLNTGKHGVFYSLMLAVWWYLKNKRRKFLPSEGMKVNGEPVRKGTTDYLAVNGPVLAGLMKGGEWYLKAKGFGSAKERLSGFWRMVSFGLKSVLFGMPLEESQGDVLEFAQAVAVEIQAEGEYERLEDVRRIEVKGTKRALKVVQV